MNKTYMSPLSKFAIGLSAIIPPIFGWTSANIDRVNKLNLGLMDKVADIGETFMTEHAHAFAASDKFLDIYSLECIIGACKSLVIGALVYLIIIRPLLMKKNENGLREYVNVWPEKLDLENSFYRPVIMVGLVSVLSFIFRIFDKLTDHVYPVLLFILSFVFRICDKIVDGIVYLIRSIFMTALNTDKGGEPFAVLREESRHSKALKLVTNSLDYSLILFCIGLSVALIYLVLLHID
jgi:hydrogenase-4 component B